MKRAAAILMSFFCCMIFFTGCSKTPDASLKEAAAYVYQTVLDPHHENWLETFNAQQTGDRLKVGTDLYTEAAVYASANATCGTVFAGFRVADGKADALRNALKTTKETYATAFDGYLPDQFNIAKNAETKEYGDYFFLIMTDKNEEVEKALDSFFNGQLPQESDSESAKA